MELKEQFENAAKESKQLPFKEVQASYFALLTKSKGLEGGSVFTSPSVPCL